MIRNTFFFHKTRNLYCPCICSTNGCFFFSYISRECQSMHAIKVHFWISSHSLNLWMHALNTMRIDYLINISNYLHWNDTAKKMQFYRYKKRPIILPFLYCFMLVIPFIMFTCFCMRCAFQYRFYFKYLHSYFKQVFVLFLLYSQYPMTSSLFDTNINFVRWANGIMQSIISIASRIRVPLIEKRHEWKLNPDRYHAMRITQNEINK